MNLNMICIKEHFKI